MKREGKKKELANFSTRRSKNFQPVNFMPRTEEPLLHRFPFLRFDSVAHGHRGGRGKSVRGALFVENGRDR